MMLSTLCIIFRCFYNRTVFLVFLLLLTNCSTVRLQKKGKVIPLDYTSEVTFKTNKQLIILSGNLNGTNKDFIFDTGADYSLIQRDSLIGIKGRYKGASKRKMKLGSEYINSLKIGRVDYQNTYSLNGNLVGLKEHFENFGGIIGQPIISKSNWLLNYPERKITISNKNLIDNSFTKIKLTRVKGAPYTFLSFDNKLYRVIIDLGSSSDFNVPENTELASYLLKTYDFKVSKRERYTLGGSQIITEKIGIIPLIKLGGFEFKNVKTSINVSSQIRLGIGFFRDFMIYIDNSEKQIHLKHTN